MTDRAATVIPLPLSVVESNIWNVASWPAFVADVEWVTRSGHERYVIGVRQGRRVHEVPVAVRWHARDHRVTWRELAGPAWRGEIRLTAVNGRRTRATMSITVHPRGFLDSLAEMIGGRRRDLSLDLHLLAERLSSIPQPYNPTRLAPTRSIEHRGERAAARHAERSAQAAPTEVPFEAEHASFVPVGATPA